MDKEKVLSYAREAFSIEADGVIATGKTMDYEALYKAVALLAAADRIASSGCGHSGIACMHFAHLMCCIDRPARFISPSEAVHGATGFIHRGDVMVLASRGGKTSELLPILDICRKKGATVITVTENLESPLAKGADIVLPIKVNKETDKYNSQGTTSFATLSAVFDALQSALVEYTGFRNEEFAINHPGGAVGERLNNKPIIM